MNRFHKKKYKRRISFSVLFPFITFIPIIVLFYQGIHSISHVNEQEQEASLRTALRQNIVHCYAIEGRYPPSLDYLEKNYGITYNKDKYFIDYQPIGTNIYPDITIIPIKNNDEE